MHLTLIANLASLPTDPVRRGSLVEVDPAVQALDGNPYVISHGCDGWGSVSATTSPDLIPALAGSAQRPEGIKNTPVSIHGEQVGVIPDAHHGLTNVGCWGRKRVGSWYCGRKYCLLLGHCTLSDYIFLCGSGDHTCDGRGATQFLNKFTSIHNRFLSKA